MSLQKVNVIYHKIIHFCIKILIFMTDTFCIICRRKRIRLRLWWRTNSGWDVIKNDRRNKEINRLSVFYYNVLWCFCVQQCLLMDVLSVCLCPSICVYVSLVSRSFNISSPELFSSFFNACKFWLKLDVQINILSMFVPQPLKSYPFKNPPSPEYYALFQRENIKHLEISSTEPCFA